MTILQDYLTYFSINLLLLTKSVMFIWSNWTGRYQCCDWQWHDRL